MQELQGRLWVYVKHSIWAEATVNNIFTFARAQLPFQAMITGHQECSSFSKLPCTNPCLVYAKKPGVVGSRNKNVMQSKWTVVKSTRSKKTQKLMPFSSIRGLFTWIMNESRCHFLNISPPYRLISSLLIVYQESANKKVFQLSANRDLTVNIQNTFAKCYFKSAETIVSRTSTAVIIGSNV